MLLKTELDIAQKRALEYFNKAGIVLTDKEKKVWKLLTLDWEILN